MSERCEPPPELRDRDGWHWVQCINGPNPDSYAPEIRWWYAPSVVANIVGWWEEADAHSDMDGYRYLAPVTPPATVAALVEALEWMITNDDTNEGDTPMPELGGQTWDEFNAYWIEGLNRARAALALYREAKR